MGREIRKVKPGWQHPKESNGRYKPLYPRNYYESNLNDFLEVQKEKGMQAAIEECGQPPDLNDYMPEWSESEANLICMYETCSEGTPISPAFSTCEELARWLSDNNASAFAGMTATYEQWLNTCKQGSSFSAAIIDGKMISGVEAMDKFKKEAQCSGSV